MTSFVRVKGHGPHQVVCLNGWFGHAADWGPFAEHLNEDQFTWHFFEYRGYGTRKSETGPYTLEQISSEICEYIAGLDSTTVSLLGHSMGGTYMQRVLVDSTARFTSMVGISPTPASGTTFDAEGRTLFEAAGRSPEARKTIIDMTTGTRLPDRWLSHMTSESLANSQEVAVEQYFSAWADCSFASEIVEANLPTLAIVGQHDPAVSTEVIEATYRPFYSDLRVVELDDAGHYAMFETPLCLLAEVEKFLKSATSNR